jgi:DNA (cytosine-5)-methyltransferase 1
MSLGFKKAGYEVIAGIDVFEDALSTYDENHNSEALNVDLGTADPIQTLTEYGIDASTIDVIAGGPPCQGFSAAGNRDPDDPRNNLLFAYLDWVEAIEPTKFVMENVTGLLSMSDGAVFESFVSRAENLGYNVAWEVLNAANYGVPQTRERLIVIGSRIDTPVHPEPTHAKVVVDE